MREAKADGQLIQASPDAPEKAVCPTCGGAVTKRKRRRMGGGITYYYRHARGDHVDCPLRYNPTGER